VLRVHQQHAQHAGGARREERAQRTARGALVRLALAVDEHVLERQVAVAREIEVAEARALDQRRALRADVIGDGDWIRRWRGASQRVESADGLANLAGLTEGSRLQQEVVGRCPQHELDFQIHGLSGDLHVDGLFPARGLWKELPEPLSRDSPVILRPAHRFTGPIRFSVC
jgi:hypothetical protein